MSDLRLTLFGAPEVTRSGTPVRFDTRKAVAMLAFLAVTGRPQRRETLAALLWPESDESRARASLRRTLSVAGAAGPALVITRNEVGLDPTLCSTDVAAFERLAAATDRAALSQARRLATGRFLEGFTLRDSPAFDDWSATMADRLQELRASVLARLTTELQRVNETGEALRTGREWVELDPLSEAAHRQLMRLYVETGQRPAALRQYRTCVRSLDRELGVAPLAETTELYDDIKANRLGATAKPEPSSREVSDPAAVTSDVVPFIGRTSEVESLVSAWRAAAQEGGATSIVSAVGIGRTRLAGELRDRVADAGGSTLLVRGHAAESTLAYAAVLDLAHQLTERDPSLASDLHAVGRSIDSPGERIQLFDMLRRSVAQALSGRVPGLLVIDDAQWLDPTSADLVGYLARRPPPGVLVVTTWANEHPESTSTGASPRGVHLRPWTLNEVTEALSLLGHQELDPVQAHRRTGGNPRLLLEFALAHSASEATSTELHELIGARLDQTPSTTKQILATTAVLATVSDPDLIRQVSGRDEGEVVDAFEDGVARGLLVEDREHQGYEFPYEALRQAVLERLSLARLRLLHGRAADALLRRHSTAPIAARAAQIAHHLAVAGREEEARDWFWKAAQHSASLFAHREALDHLRSALALGHDPSDVHVASGDALTRLARYAEALTAYEQAAASIDATDVATLAVIEHKLAEVHDRIGRWSVAQAHLESAKDLLGDTGLMALKAQVEADLALVLYRQSLPEATDAGALALSLAEQSGDDTSLAQAHNVYGVASSLDPQRARRHFMASREFAHDAGRPELEAAALNNLSRSYAADGQLEPALTAARDALALGIAQGDLHRVAALHDHLADLLHQYGRDDEAMEHLKLAAQTFAAVDDAQSQPEVWKLVTW